MSYTVAIPVIQNEEENKITQQCKSVIGYNINKWESIQGFPFGEVYFSDHPLDNRRYNFEEVLLLFNSTIY